LQPDWALLYAPGDAPTCPAVRDGAPRASYYYLGYEITSDEAAEAFATAVSTRIAQGGAFEGDLHVSDSVAGTTIPRLRDQASSAAARDPAQIPVVLERATNHHTAGMHVLYQDGHVEYITFGERFPGTRRTLRALATLESGLYPVAPLAPEQLRHWEPGACGGGFVWEGPKN
jgi:prepilin-type processing-associated H-X9-DG protein